MIKQCWIHPRTCAPDVTFKESLAVYLTSRLLPFTGPGFTTRTRSSTKSLTRNINSHQQSRLSTMMKSLDTETTAKLESSPKEELGGENSYIRRWRRLLREFRGRRRIRDNLYGMHELRPYDQGGDQEVSTVWTGAVMWLERMLRPDAKQRVSRTTRARVNTRSPRRNRRHPRPRIDQLSNSKQLSKELARLIKRE